MKTWRDAFFCMKSPKMLRIYLMNQNSDFSLKPLHRIRLTFSNVLSFVSRIFSCISSLRRLLIMGRRDNAFQKVECTIGIVRHEIDNNINCNFNQRNVNNLQY